MKACRLQVDGRWRSVLAAAILLTVPGDAGDSVARAGDGQVKDIAQHYLKLQLNDVDTLKKGDDISVIRRVTHFVHPITGAVIEEQIHVLATARLREVSGRQASALVLRRGAVALEQGDTIVRGVVGTPGELAWIPPPTSEVLADAFSRELQNWSRTAGDWRVEDGMVVARTGDQAYAQMYTVGLFDTNVEITIDFQLRQLGRRGRLLLNLHDPTVDKDHYVIRFGRDSSSLFRGRQLLAVSKDFVLSDEDKAVHTLRLRRTVWHIYLELDGKQLLTYLDTDFPQGNTKFGLYVGDGEAAFDNVFVKEYPRVRKPEDSQLLDGAGKVLHVNGDQIWVRYGKTTVATGQRLPVARWAGEVMTKQNELLYHRYEKVGEIEILRPGANVSEARIRSGEQIAIGDSVFLERPNSRVQSWMIKP